MKRTTALAAAALLSIGSLVAVATPAQATTTCTVTQGFVKNRVSEIALSGKVADDVEAALLARFDTSTLKAIISLPSLGDADRIAAQQYLAAAYNGGIEASTSGVQDAFYGLSEYYQGKRVLTRGEIISYSETLDAYNNGLLNLPHCD